MAEITKLNISELDFDTIKTNLKDYFNSQTEFTDHNFGGSAISVFKSLVLQAPAVNVPPSVVLSF